MPHPRTNWDDSWNNPGNWGGAGDSWGGAPRRALPWKPLLIVLVVVVVGVVAWRALGRVVEGPDAAARRYFQAVIELRANELAARTCAATQEALMGTGAVLTAISVILNYYTGISLQDVEIDARDLSYTTLSQSGDRAEVRVNGTVRSSILFLSMPYPMDEYWLMVREGGRWKWCGYTRPPAVPSLTPP